MVKDYPEIIRNIKSGEYAPLYFLQGDEPFFVDNIIDHIEENALDDTQKSFNQYIFYGKETDFSTIFSTARKFPMMGDRQVVIIKEAQEIRGWNIEENQALINNYLENLVPSTILVFGYKYKVLDKRTKLAKSIDKHAIVLNSKRIYDNKVPAWIESYARARGIEISGKAVMLLAENIGNNLQRLSNEIEKLLINLEGQKSIDENTVHKFIGISKEYNTFELQDAIGDGNMSKAIKIINYMSANPASPMVLTISNLFSFFSKILLVHQSTTSDDRTLAQTLGVNPFFVGKYKTAQKRYSVQKTLENIGYIHKADLKYKGIDSPTRAEGEILKELIYQLMN